MEKWRDRAIYAVIWLACAYPLATLLYGLGSDMVLGTSILGANPIETITRKTGTWTFNFLLITLTVTPVLIAT